MDSEAKYHSNPRSYASARNGSRSGLPAVTERELPETLTDEPGFNWPRLGRVITFAAPTRISSESLKSYTRFNDGSTSSYLRVTSVCSGEPLVNV